MRIDEFAQPMNDNLPFDVVDDVAIFMRNDPMFYRKVFFPAVIEMKKNYDTNQKNSNSKALFKNIVEKATTQYCKKYNIGKRPEDLLSDQEVENLIDKLFSEEMAQIRKGAY